MSSMNKIILLSAGLVCIVFLFGGALAETQDTETQPAGNPILLKSRVFVPEETAPVSLNALAETTRERVHVILQLNYIPSNEDKLKLSEQGIILLEYIPENAWLASVPASSLNSIAGMREITFISDLEARDKLSPVFQNYKAPEYIKNSDNSVNLTVVFFEDVTREEAEKYISKYGYVISGPSKYRHLWNVKLDESKLKEFVSEDIVSWIEPGVFKLQTLNDGAREATGVNTVHHSPYLLNGSGVAVAVWDEGHANHTDFNDRTTVGDPDDGSTSNHATHVAGTVLGNGSNSESEGGTARQWKGMAPNATLITYEWPEGLLVAAKNELYDETNESATSYGAVISQNSWGYDASSDCSVLGLYNEMTRAYDDIVNGYNVSGNKFTVVFAAGNERNEIYCDIPSNPYNTTIGPGATAKNTITVGAIDDSDNSMSSFSSWGPTDDGRLKPEVVAPGVSIKSTYPTSTYTTASGTSMAAPVVSGISALIYKEYNNTQNEFPWPSTVKAILVHTALDLNETGPDYTTGYGLVNATRAVDLLRLNNDSNLKHIVQDNVSNGENRTYRFIVNDTELKLTLAWDDYPGAVQAAKELVNDLDLVVTAPNGSRMYPWTLDKDNPSEPAVRNQSNNVDVIEQVLVSNPENGTWTVVVNGTTVPYAPENFTLVSSSNLDETFSPVINIMTENNSVSTNSTPVIYFNFTDNLQETAMATLYFNGTNVSYNGSVQNNTKTNLSVSSGLEDGNYTFWVNLSVGFQNQKSEEYNLLISTVPSVTLLSPADGLKTNNSTVLFNCSAIDYSGLTNMTLYTNISGVWTNNTTHVASGTSNWSNWTLSGLSNGTYIWNCRANNTENNSAFAESNFTFTIDQIPPYGISNLTAASKDAGWIYWNWTNPNNTDFNYTEVWLNNSWLTNTSNNFYNATGLIYNTTYELGLRTVDTIGNRNLTFVNNTTNTTLDNASPSVILQLPDDDSSTTSSSAVFNCSATDNYNLSNISLYGNFEGSWALIETRNVSGLSNWSNFTVELSNGEYEWNCMAFDVFSHSASAGSNYTITKSSPSTSSSGGGGGGVGGISLPQESINFGKISEGETAVKSFSNTDGHTVSRIEVKVNKDVSNAIITVIKYINRPFSVSEPENPEYAYLNIKPVNFESEDIDEINISFRVNKTWLSSNNASPEEVILLRDVNGSWEELETEKSYETSVAYTFKSTSKGLSIFASSFKELRKEPEIEPEQETEIEDELEEVHEPDMEAFEREEEFFITLYYIILLSILIITLIVAAAVVKYWPKSEID